MSDWIGSNGEKWSRLWAFESGMSSEWVSEWLEGSSEKEMGHHQMLDWLTMITDDDINPKMVAVFENKGFIKQ